MLHAVITILVALSISLPSSGDASPLWVSCPPVAMAAAGSFQSEQLVQAKKPTRCCGAGGVLWLCACVSPPRWVWLDKVREGRGWWSTRDAGWQKVSSLFTDLRISYVSIWNASLTTFIILGHTETESIDSLQVIEARTEWTICKFVFCFLMHNQGMHKGRWGSSDGWCEDFPCMDNTKTEKWNKTMASYNVTLLNKKLLSFDLNDETEELLITSGGKEFHFGNTSRKKECLWPTCGI